MYFVWLNHSFFELPAPDRTRKNKTKQFGSETFMCALFQKLKSALKGSGGGSSSSSNSNSTRSGATPETPMPSFDKHWDIARVALHSVPTRLQSAAYDSVQVCFLFFVIYLLFVFVNIITCT